VFDLRRETKDALALSQQGWIEVIRLINPVTIAPAERGITERHNLPPTHC
jgi:hypothetical protein